MKRILFSVSAIVLLIIIVVIFSILPTNKFFLLLFNLSLITLFDAFYLRLVKTVDYINYSTLPLSKFSIFIKLFMNRLLGYRLVVIGISVCLSVIFKKAVIKEIVIFLELYFIYTLLYVLIEHISKRKMLYFRLVYHNLSVVSGIFIASSVLYEKFNFFFQRINFFYLKHEIQIIIYLLGLLILEFYLFYKIFYYFILKYPFPKKDVIKLMIYR